MKIEEIIKESGAELCFGSPATEPLAIKSDSRTVVPGDLFIAVAGCSDDGSRYIDDARAKGAVAAVRTDREGLARIAATFYGNPSSKLDLVGITGTNGKTTTVTLLFNMFRSLGYKCGMLSTIENRCDDEVFEARNTTSDPITINSLLAMMVEKGCRYCFMEVSSIGVEQKRTAFLKFKVGIFSNLTHDHLDYHGTFEEYLRCKKMFFDALPKGAVAITNKDDKNGLVMVQNTRAKVMTYSCRSLAEHSARILEQTVEGMLLSIDGEQVWLRLVGRHNAYNALAVYCTALALGAGKQDALVCLSRLEGAKGRLETIHCPGGKTVVIDYAHTPDALENVLKTLRDICALKPLVCLFGCGGDRDRTKRPEMAAVAQKYADRIVVSSDNSRSERTEDIMAEIREGFNQAGLRKAVFIADRAEAIRAAISFAPEGAVILLAGKGHETYQINADGYEHFDEREIVRDIFK